MSWAIYLSNIGHRSGRSGCGPWDRHELACAQFQLFRAAMSVIVDKQGCRCMAGHWRCTGHRGLAVGGASMCSDKTTCFAQACVTPDAVACLQAPIFFRLRLRAVVPWAPLTVGYETYNLVRHLPAGACSLATRTLGMRCGTATVGPPMACGWRSRWGLALPPAMCSGIAQDFVRSLPSRHAMCSWDGFSCTM